MDMTRRELIGGAAALLASGGSNARGEPSLPFASEAPVSVARVGLRARDHENLAGYYKALLGLTETRRTGSVIGLGAGGRELLEIEGSATLRPDDPRSAGLYHTAFLLPSRHDLALWTKRAIIERIPVDGASDHLVSEAIYLTDPEGNGIEIYADRPRHAWKWEGSSVSMATKALNVESLLAELGPNDDWKGVPEASVVGHVHLRAGDALAAEAWWNRVLGFDTVRKREDAVFLSTGGYHHHIAANTWQSKGAGRREADRTGLAFVELASKAAQSTSVRHDEWGNEVRVVPAKLG